MYRIKDDNSDFLIDCILHLDNSEEAYQFFENICTPQEFHTMAQRIVVAKMLCDNKVYSDIIAKTGASTATISRVNRSIQAGPDGYYNIFRKLDNE
ncbi:MAG: TrpR-like protein, YerC/YecD [Clostridiales bacterium]|nr:TrpR-like protein, YerC/YecD [Clostridiales bacterium]